MREGIRLALAIAAKDVRAEVRSRTALLSATVFAALVLVVFNFARDPTAIAAVELAPSVLWVTFALAAMGGGLLLIVGNAILLADPDARGLASGADYGTVAILVVGALAVCGGLLGVQLRQRAAYGRLGLIGFVLASVAQVAQHPGPAGVAPTPITRLPGCARRRRRRGRGRGCRSSRR